MLVNTGYLNFIQGGGCPFGGLHIPCTCSRARWSYPSQYRVHQFHPRSRMSLWWTSYTRYLLPCQVELPQSIQGTSIPSKVEDVPLVDFIYPVFAPMPGGVTPGDSGLCCCVPGLLSAVSLSLLLCPWSVERCFAISVVVSLVC